MEAAKLATLADLLAHPEERVELIDGEIVSPGHERKDTLTLLLLLQHHRVPYYWLIWPEERTLVAYGLDGVSYRIVANLTAAGPNAAPDAERVAIPPFEAVPIDLGYILGG